MAKKTIIVVDDEPNIAQLVKDTLEPAGYNVVIASNGPECLKKLKTTKPDLMLVDFFMPEMSGRELCAKIRADSNLKNIKIAFLTVARFSPEGLNELKKMNILDNIQKPFDLQDLIARVKKMIG